MAYMTPYAIHGPGGWDLLPSNSWYVGLAELGADPNNHSGDDYSEIAAKGIKVVVRVDYSHHGEGTVPSPEMMDDYAKRVVNWVQASKGVYCIIIGNEPNYSVEWFGGKELTRELYCDAYETVWRAVSAVSNIEITHAAIAPWNTNSGHWLDYFEYVVNRLANKISFINLHTYTHGVDPNLIFSTAKMDAPNEHLYYHFRAFEDFLDKAQNLLHIPVIITETDENDPWADVNSGWIVNAYNHCDWYSKQPKKHKIFMLAIYRWSEDKWEFQSKPGVQNDFRNAVALNLTTQFSTEKHTVYIPNVIAPPEEPMPPTELIVWDSQLDQRGVVLVNYKPTSGETYTDLIDGQYYDEVESQGKVNAFFDVVDENGVRLTHDEYGNPMTVTVSWDNGQEYVDVLLEAKPGEPWAGSFIMGSAGGGENYPASGYAAQVTNYVGDTVQGFALGDIAPEKRYYNIHVSYGFRWKRKKATANASPIPTTPVPAPDVEVFNEGDKVSVATKVNIRKTPGTVSKPSDDILYVLPPGAIVMLLEGPHHTDGLSWWLVAGRDGKAKGWIAENATPNGLSLFDIDTSNFELYSFTPHPTEEPTPDQAHLPDYLVRSFARVQGMEVRLAKAFIDVESGAQPFGPDGRVLIRFEAHIFRNQLQDNTYWSKFFKVDPNDNTKDQQWRFVDGGVWQPIHTGQQSSEYAAFEFAAKIHRAKAFNSISMGLGQIMGFNDGLLSYPSAEAMYNDFGHPQWGYYNQLVGFFAYIQNKPGMLDAVREKNFRQMSILYNGSVSYEPLLRSAYEHQTN